MAKSEKKTSIGQKPKSRKSQLKIQKRMDNNNSVLKSLSNK